MKHDPTSDRWGRLRSQALQALEEAQALAPSASADVWREPAALLEELRIHQAELEVQNDELLRTRQEAQEAHHHYLTLFESLPIAALVVDTRGLILEANPRACTLFGFRTLSSLRRHSVYRLAAAASATAIAEGLRQTSADARVALPLLQVRTTRGELIEMEAHLSQLPSDAADQRSFLLLLLDRSAEMRHAKQASLYQTVLNHADALVYAFDRQYRCVLANDSFLAHLGQPRERVIGCTLAQLFVADAAHAHEERDAQVFATGAAQVYEDRPHEHGYSGPYLLHHKFPLRDPEGEIFAVGTISTDITQVRKTARRLELALQVYSQGSEGVLISDAHNAIISVNRAFEQITGYTEAEVLGKNPRFLASGRHDAGFYQAMWEQIDRVGHWEGEIWNRRKAGDAYPEWLTISRVGSKEGGAAHYIGVFSDITRRKWAEEEIERLAFFDPLTNLPNRHLLQDRVQQALQLAQRNGTGFALAYIDLDQFKEVNDVHGHGAGDELLRQVVRRIRKHVRQGDTLARIGGDEFVLLLSGIPLQECALRLQTILQQVAESYLIDGNLIYISASIGLACYPEDGSDYELLLKHADMAMYQAKSDGRNTLRFFNSAMAQSLQDKYRLESCLRLALERNELSLVYQPQIELGSVRLCGLEALLRWHSTELGEVGPARFIPNAEQTGMIHAIGHWVLEQVCRQLALWQRQGLDGFSVAVNVSAKEFWADDFVERIQHLLQTYQVPGERLEIELTERLVMFEAERAIVRMKQLSELGLRLSIDDFGTGYSSLAYLRWMPVKMLKLDKSFVDTIGINKDAEVICRTVIDLARGLGMVALAEGVESKEQALFLQAAGCQLAQGYLFAHPMPAQALEHWIQAQQV